MDILIQTVLSGLAVAYVVEFLTSLVESFISARLIRQVVTPPLAFYGCWLFSITGFPLIVCGLAASFVAMLLMKLVNKPVVTNVNTRR